MKIRLKRKVLKDNIKFLFSNLLHLLSALFLASSYRCKVIDKKWVGLKVKYKVIYKPRWYFVVYYVVLIILLFYYLYFHGLKEFFITVKNEFTDDTQTYLEGYVKESTFNSNFKVKIAEFILKYDVYG